MNIQAIPLTNLQELQQISQIAYSQNFGHHWEGNGLALYLEEQFNNRRLSAELADPGIGYYFIEDEGDTVGFVKIRWQSPLPGEVETQCCEIEKIYLLPDQKGKGLGRFAVEYLQQVAIDKGKTILFFCVIDTNTAAMAFYQRLGFDFHSKTSLDAPLFKEELRGMHRMYKRLSAGSRMRTNKFLQLFHHLSRSHKKWRALMQLIGLNIQYTTMTIRSFPSSLFYQ